MYALWHIANELLNKTKPIYAEGKKTVGFFVANYNSIDECSVRGSHHHTNTFI